MLSFLHHAAQVQDIAYRSRHWHRCLHRGPLPRIFPNEASSHIHINPRLSTDIIPSLLATHLSGAPPNCSPCSLRPAFCRPPSYYPDYCVSKLPPVLLSAIVLPFGSSQR